MDGLIVADISGKNGTRCENFNGQIQSGCNTGSYTPGVMWHDQDWSKRSSELTDCRAVCLYAGYSNNHNRAGLLWYIGLSSPPITNLINDAVKFNLQKETKTL